MIADAIDSLWAIPSGRSAALRAEPVALSQAKPAATIARGVNDNERH